MVVVFIGAWGLYNTTEVFPKAEYDLVVHPAVAAGGPNLTRMQSRMRAEETRLRTAVAQGRISEAEARQQYDRAAQVAVSEI